MTKAAFMLLGPVVALALAGCAVSPGAATAPATQPICLFACRIDVRKDEIGNLPALQTLTTGADSDTNSSTSSRTETKTEVVD
jgi:hypothetical protein